MSSLSARIVPPCASTMQALGLLGASQSPETVFSASSAMLKVWDMADGLDGFVASEHQRWTKIIREAGIKLD